MTTWRINLKPGHKSGINARRYCLSKEIVGIGWQVNYKETPLTADYYEKKAEKAYYDKGNKSWWPAWNAFYNKMKIDDLIWTRDWDGIYYIGRIKGHWYYDTSDDASNADIVNVRECDWKKIGTIASVPGKLVNCFIPARTLQKVNDETVNLFSKIIYNEKTNSNFYKTTSLNGKDIFSLLSSDDCEDALALYLQLTKDYFLIPSSCKADTMAYEYELIHKFTKEKAIVQVKNGKVNINIEDYSNIDRTVFLFTTKGKYFGKKTNGIHLISPDEIRNFLYSNIEFLPDKMKIWVKLTNNKSHNS